MRRRTGRGGAGAGVWPGAPALGVFALAIVLMAGADGARAQSDVGRVADVLASAWESGDPGALQAFLPDDGIDLSLDGSDHRGVSRRQARAALERFLAAFERGAVTVRRAEALGGDPARGLVELSWTVRAAGTPEERSFVIFVSLERSLDDWCIEEIRVFS